MSAKSKRKSKPQATLGKQKHIVQEPPWESSGDWLDQFPKDYVGGQIVGTYPFEEVAGDLAGRAVARMKAELESLPGNYPADVFHPSMTGAARQKYIVEEIRRGLPTLMRRHEEEFLGWFPATLPEHECELARKLFHEKADPVVKEFCRKHGLEVPEPAQPMRARVDGAPKATEPSNATSEQPRAAQSVGVPANMESVQPTNGGGEKTQYRTKPDPRPVRSEEELRGLRSLLKVEAARELKINPRTIYNRIKAGKLTTTPNGRVVVDDKFIDIYRQTHLPAS